MKTGKKIRNAVILLALLCVGAYLGIAYYYMDGFSFGTWINGVYCTGKSVAQVNEELLSQISAPELTVIYPVSAGEELPEEEQSSSHFILDAQMLQQDYTKSLQQLLQRQRPLMWPQNLFLRAGGYELKPAVSFTEEGKEAFEEAFLSDKTVQAEIGRDACIRLEKDEREGIRLYDGKKNRLDTEKAFGECVNAVEEGKTEVLLSSACYYDEKSNEEEKEQQALYQELQEFLDFEIIYDMGAEQVRFDRKALVELLAVEETGMPESTAKEEAGKAEGAGKEGERSDPVPQKEDMEFAFVRDENGAFCWDQEKVKAAVDRLADTYDTYGKPREFAMTGGGTVTLEKGNYGTQLDRKAEEKWLSEALAERKSEMHMPSYSREAYARGEDDIGDTYVEINMTKQKLWFYMEGKVEIETPIVTGNMMRRRGTPEGVYFVYGKQKNRILRGPGYASHVNYWMPVKGGVGMHDALWRDEFGGDIYKKEGSHGCINLPLEAAEKMYGLIEIGVPVILYYEEEDAGDS